LASRFLVVGRFTLHECNPLITVKLTAQAWVMSFLALMPVLNIWLCLSQKIKS
jgi:hypothetical protein